MTINVYYPSCYPARRVQPPSGTLPSSKVYFNAVQPKKYPDPWLLSPPEAQVLRDRTSGKSIQEIANASNPPYNYATIRTKIKNALTKIGIKQENLIEWVNISPTFPLSHQEWVAQGWSYHNWAIWIEKVLQLPNNDARFCAVRDALALQKTKTFRSQIVPNVIFQVLEEITSKPGVLLNVVFDNLKLEPAQARQIREELKALAPDSQNMREVIKNAAKLGLVTSQEAAQYNAHYSLPASA